MCIHSTIFQTFIHSQFIMKKKKKNIYDSVSSTYDIAFVTTVCLM